MYVHHTCVSILCQHNHSSHMHGLYFVAHAYMHAYIHISASQTQSPCTRARSSGRPGVSKKVFIVCSNPIGTSFSNAIADSAAKGLTAAGILFDTYFRLILSVDNGLLHGIRVHCPHTQDMRCEQSICMKCQQRHHRAASRRCCRQRRGRWQFL